LGQKTVVIFGSSAVKPGDALYSEARELGRLLASKGFTVCNGGYDGTMEASARGAKEAGGACIGVTTPALKGHQRNPWIDRELVIDDYLERMAILFDKGDGFLALSGGVGTLSEVLTLWCLLVIRAMPAKPAVLIGEPWRKLLDLLTREFFFKPQQMAHLQWVSSVPEAVETLERAFDIEGEKIHAG
jgi:hypothetical protein